MTTCISDSFIIRYITSFHLSDHKLHQFIFIDKEPGHYDVIEAINYPHNIKLVSEVSMLLDEYMIGECYDDILI